MWIHVRTFDIKEGIIFKEIADQLALFVGDTIIKLESPKDYLNFSIIKNSEIWLDRYQWNIF